MLANRTMCMAASRGRELARCDRPIRRSNHIQPTAKLADWGPQAEASLVAAISEGIDSPRIAVMKSNSTASPGSFHSTGAEAGTTRTR